MTSRLVPTNDPSGERELSLTVRNLRIDLDGPPSVSVVDSVSFRITPNQTLGIVGESGSGKTMLCRALIGTLGRHGARLVGGSIRIGARDLSKGSAEDWRQVRGRILGYIPQSSLIGLNPVLSVGTQLIDSIRSSRRVSHLEAQREALELLDRVRIANARAVFDLRAAHLSGGMRQRVVIASAIAQRPSILVADEPTTALDVSIERDILELLEELRRELAMGLILVSHDLTVVERVCDQIMVMYAGAAVELGNSDILSARSRHPYTRRLATSRLDQLSPRAPIKAISGEAVSVGFWPEGCRFWPRCDMATAECKSGQQPDLALVDDGHESACIHADQLT